MQFGINKHEQIFQRLQKIARGRRASAICSLWKICECLFIPNCTRKIIWLLVNNIQVTISVTLQHCAWQMKATIAATSTLLDKNLTCEFKHKNSFTLSKSCIKTEQFLWTLKSSLYPQLNIEEFDHKAKEKLTSLRLSSQMSFKWLRNCEPCLPREETIQLSTSYLNQNTEKLS